MRWELILMFLVLSTSASAFYRFDPYVDLNSIDWFDRALYIAGEETQPCLNLEEFYAYADSDPYDSFDREDIRDRDNLNRLSYNDFLIVANEDRYDRIDPDDFDDRDDFRCTPNSQYREFADSNPYDKFDYDDYYQIYGFDDQKDFDNWARHDTTEYYPTKRPVIYPSNYHTPYTIDQHGGFVSWFPFS